MARSREFKPEAVLEAALDLFWRKGYKACSMADVVRKSGVARYGLYQAFKDKDQLYCAALKRYRQKVYKIMNKACCDNDSGKEKLDYNSLVKHFDLILEQLEKGIHQGCFAHQAAIERAGESEDVRVIVEEFFNDAKDNYRTMIKNGIELGQIRNVDVEDLVVYVMGIQRTIIAMSKQNCSLQERKNYVRCALAMLQAETPTTSDHKPKVKI